MTTIWAGILSEARDDLTLILAGGFLLTAAIVALAAPRERRRLRAMLAFIVVHLALVPVAGILRAHDSMFYLEARFLALIPAALAAILMGSTLILSVALGKLQLVKVHILRDLLIAAASALAFFAIASKLGFNLSGLIATSAVLTAVLGFSLQDTLGNLIAGLALQLDNSIHVGDWLKLPEMSGKVTEIGWRHTEIETRNWETVIVPNSVLMKSSVTVLGRRRGQPLQWRRWIHFNVDFRFQPSEVLGVVEELLRNVAIEGVAANPPPSGILLGLEESYARYAIRYWLTDLQRDDPTDSIVRTRLFFALERAKIPLSIPAHKVFQEKVSVSREAEKSRAEFDRRMQALKQVELILSVSDEERAMLAEHLRYAPFTAGEIITKQGAEPHWLYLLVEGEVSIRVATKEGLEREVNVLKAPSVFGEMSLMTGHPREATVVAIGDAGCYRLQASAFREIAKLRPEVAEHCAELVSQRIARLHAVKEDLDQEAQAKRAAVVKKNVLGSVRSFFGLDDAPDTD